MPFNHARAQAVCDRQIKRFGQNALLRRSTGDRACVVAFTDILARDTNGQLLNPVSIIAIMLAGDGVVPDYQEDSLVVIDQTTEAELFVHRLTAPSTRLGTSNVSLYWEIRIQQNGRAR